MKWRREKCAQLLAVLGIALVMASCGIDTIARDRGPSASSQQSLNSAPTIGQFVLYAERSVKLGSFSHADGGDVGVRSTAVSSFGAQMIIGDHAHLDSSHTLLAPSVTLGLDAQIGDVQTTALHDEGTRKLGTVAAFSAAAMPPLPLARPLGGGSGVDVGAHQSVALPPGTYGALTVGEYGAVTLAAGTYSFSSVTMAQHAELSGDAAGVDVSISGTLAVDEWVKIGPLGAHTTAGKLSIVVAGSDGANGSPAAASLGAHDHVQALLSAPHGTLSLGDEVLAAGAFAGFDVIVGHDAQLTFQSGFAVAPPGQQGQQQLHGYYGPSPDPTVAPVVGPVPGSTLVALSIGLPVRDPAGLQSFIDAVSDPKSPTYRQFLTQAQFTATYGATASDYQALVDWAEAQGLTVYATYSNNLLLGVSGTAAQIEQALFTNLVYRQRRDGSSFVTVDRDPSVSPLDQSQPLQILRISGLDDFVLPTPGVITLNGTATDGNYFAADIRNAYLGVDSTCQRLDGTGQVIGLFELDNFAMSDIQGYDNLQNPPSATNVQVAPVQNPPLFAPGFGNPDFQFEVTLDIEMARAMAPGALILVFEGSTGITGHGDDLLHAMATSNPPLTVASSSWQTGRSDNAQQAINQMAAQGVSFFQTAGDFGDIGDPQSNVDMDNQTLVGGTMLSTHPLSGGVYPKPYYAGEATWNDGDIARKGDVTGGGIMNGTNLGTTAVTQCRCWPQATCCGSGVAIPGYQRGVSMATNGGSTQFRNFPDVALLADDVGVFFGGEETSAAGTSAAAPLWAGFVALANQASVFGRVGFANPVLYDIGLTRGSANDLYAACFNDINDGVSNFDGFGGGFISVDGYDLTTGWGTPTCQLINQLSSPAPLTPVTVLTGVELLIITGNDDLRTNSSATADLVFPGGGAITIPLKSSGEPGWGNGTVHDLHVQLPSTLNPPLTETNGLSQVRITLHQNFSPPDTPDNWDISGLFVRLFNPGSPEVCQINLGTIGALQDGHPGLVRLSQSADASGVGPTVSFAGGSGCATGSPPGTFPPSTIQFIVATGGDDLRDNSELKADLFFPLATAPFQTITLKAGGSAWDNNTLQNLTFPLFNEPPGAPFGGLIDHIVVSLIEHNGPFQTDDNWNLEGINILTSRVDSPARSDCLVQLSGDPLLRFTGSAGSMTLTRGGCP